MANSIISKVYLLDTPLKNDYKDTFYFKNKSAQETYFHSRVKHTFQNVTYLRKEKVIKVNIQYDNICTCNYLMYQNTAYSNKWIYCFIKDMKYISDGVTEIEIETDVIQTYLFDYVVNRSFVEREHVNNDSVGLHTIPEGLETGDYICNEQIVDSKGEHLHIYLAISDYGGRVDSDLSVQGAIYDGLYSGLCYEVYNNTKDGKDALNAVIKKYDEAGKADGIHSIFLGPYWLGSSGDYDETFKAATKAVSYAPVTYNPTGISKPSKIDGYTPRNKKLLTYPFSYLMVSNNNGSNVIYQYEYFNDDVCNFEVNGCLTPGCSIRMHPLWYKGIVSNYEEGINAGKYPMCAWNSDSYTNWLTQNAVNNGVTIGSGIATTVLGGAAMLTGAGAVAGVSMMASGVSMIAQTIGQTYQASKIPDQAKGNTNCGDVVTASNTNCFMFYKMSIKQEFAKILDDYFDMFGYKVIDTKIPNKDHRAEHWYTKTIDANITGAIPGTDLQKIKDCYNQGLRFWRNPGNIHRYDLANNIV